MQETLAFLGVGGFAGTMLGIWFGGKRLAGRLQDLRDQAERAAKDPLGVDLNDLARQVHRAEQEARSLWRMIQGVFR